MKLYFNGRYYEGRLYQSALGFHTFVTSDKESFNIYAQSGCTLTIGRNGELKNVGKVVRL